MKFEIGKIQVNFLNYNLQLAQRGQCCRHMEGKSDGKRYLLRCHVREWITGLCLLFLISLQAQNTKIDSLKASLKVSTSDSLRITTYNLLAFHTYRILPDTALAYARAAFDLSEEIGDSIGKAYSHNSFGILAYANGRYDSALWHYEKFLALCKAGSDSAGMTKAFNNVGILYNAMGQVEKSLEHYGQALEIKEAMNDLNGLGPIYNNMGLLHKNLGNYRESMDFYQKAIDAKRDGVRLIGRAISYLNMATLKEILDDYEGAKFDLSQALEIYTRHSDKKGLAMVYHHYGLNLLKVDSLHVALSYFHKALKVHEELNNLKQIAENLREIAELKIKTMEWDSSFYFLNRASKISTQLNETQLSGKIMYSLAKLYMAQDQHELAEESGLKAYEAYYDSRSKKEIFETALLLSEIYHSKGQNGKAYEFLTVYHIYRDSVINENKLLEIAKIEFNHELSRIENENQLLMEAHKEMGDTLNQNKRQLASQRIALIWGGVVLAIVIVSIVVIFNFYRQVKQAKDSLRAANKEISIFNQSLEQKVQDRTEKIEKQNQQLMDYAFAISHEIRSPLTNLIGLLDLDKNEKEDDFSDEEKQQIKYSMVNSIQKIDEATRKAAQIGSQDQSKATEN